MADETKACGNDAMADLINVGTVRSWLIKRNELSNTPIVKKRLREALECLDVALLNDKEGCLRAANQSVPNTDERGPSRRLPTRGPA